MCITHFLYPFISQWTFVLGLLGEGKMRNCSMDIKFQLCKMIQRSAGSIVNKTVSYTYVKRTDIKYVKSSSHTHTTKERKFLQVMEIFSTLILVMISWVYALFKLIKVFTLNVCNIHISFISLKKGKSLNKLIKKKKTQSRKSSQCKQTTKQLRSDQIRTLINMYRYLKKKPRKFCNSV